MTATYKHVKEQFHTTESLDRFTNSRGEMLSRWNLPATADAKAVCILVHGVLEHAGAYEDMATIMHKSHNIVVYAYDQVGHGKSDGNRVDILNFQHYVDDLIQFVDIVKRECAEVPLFIMGHALGGLVLGHALLKKPDLCDGAIMYSAIIQPNPNIVFSNWATRFFSHYVPSFPVGCFEPAKLTSSDEEVQKMKSDPLRYQGGLKARWAQNILQSAPDFQARMGEIAVPLYVAHGGADTVCMVDGAVQLHDMAKSKDKSINVYENCSHRLHSEPNGEGQRFIDDVCEWIIKRSDKM